MTFDRRIFNFAAGPATLPADVLQQASIPLSVFFSWVALLLPYVIYMILPLVAVVTTFLVYHYS
jgi:lipopolysaccharide export LptBFGC system permease protein LptF